MGLSNYLPTSAIAKPGVCTSSTRPASPYDGQVIYETDTDKTLVWNGSAWVYLSTSTANPVGLELIKTQTIGSGVTSVTVSDAFNSNYDNYRLVWSGGTASGLLTATLKLGSSATGYYSVVNYATYAATTTPLSAGNNNSAYWDFVGYASGNYSQMSVDLIGPYLTQYTTFNASSWAAITVSGTASGIHQVSASYTSFTFGPAPGAGTYSGGTIYVYGYRKA